MTVLTVLTGSATVKLLGNSPLRSTVCCLLAQPSFPEESLNHLLPENFISTFQSSSQELVPFIYTYIKRWNQKMEYKKLGSFFRLRARITSLIARTTAARILGYSCLVGKKVRFHPFPSQHHECNPYFLLAPPPHITSIEAHTSAPVQT